MQQTQRKIVFVKNLYSFKVTHSVASDVGLLTTVVNSTDSTFCKKNAAKLLVHKRSVFDKPHLPVSDSSWNVITSL